MTVEQLYNIFKDNPIIVTDTRKCQSDSIFFALKGTQFNGNHYADKAIALGCKYAIVDEKEYADPTRNIILVEDCLETLQLLANYHRRQFRIPIIGITGTNGKTTTKELVTTVLSQEFNVLSTEGNLNNHIGVPLTLLRMNKEHEIAVIEMGASHVGEIKVLAEIADPDYGLITNIGHAHIEGFGSFENIIRTKGELYEYIRNRKDGKVFIDYDNKYLREMVMEITPIYYGLEEELFVCGKVESNNPYLSFSWKFSKNYHSVHTHLIGEYNLTNTLAAVTIGKYFGVKTAKINNAIEEYLPTNNRSQLTKTERNTLIVDAYNANPTSMNAALRNFEKMDVTNKVLILGDMKELGDGSLAAHQDILDSISKDSFDEVFLIGENFSNTKNHYMHFRELDDFLKYLETHTLSDKYILIKGSRGIQLEKTVELL